MATVATRTKARQQAPAPPAQAPAPVAPPKKTTTNPMDTDILLATVDQLTEAGWIWSGARLCQNGWHHLLYNRGNSGQTRRLRTSRLLELLTAHLVDTWHKHPELELKTKEASA